ncbi:UDP-N-acetylmuramate dehydrogenase [Fontibacillus phaseoli]|uniref:UDP-N-acetylenolpyruvoylglucosamine reductase n=1 Tax=Fontibacillus phaseoli TaxID=1416533 RepID=A0A369BT18_9BACL|nr:FAD-binding protein [Fontibacillus phaseoli]RCX23828.1 UDP-N-acetylmuramate dehydrogenase [Fontibacillus phaseoli]
MTSLDLPCILKDQPLSNYSTYEIGGKARFLALPRSDNEVLEVLEAAMSHGMNPLFFGMGSNLLFPDTPNPENLYISTRSHREIYLQNDRLHVSAGMPMSLLALIGAVIGTSDFDFSFLLPGTLGGGIYMNAKYFSHYVSDFIDTVYYVDLDDIGRNMQSITVEHCEFGYKQSVFQRKNWFIIGADLRFNQAPSHPDALQPFLRELDRAMLESSSLKVFSAFYMDYLDRLKQEHDPSAIPMRSIIADRTGKMHFNYPSCGSVFKNNYAIGEPIGKLADRLHLRGREYGKAMISPVHGNVIQNRGGARAEDVIYLIHLVQEEINKHFGFVPEAELVIVS